MPLLEAEAGYPWAARLSGWMLVSLGWPPA
jgi:hypothetical protein